MVHITIILKGRMVHITILRLIIAKKQTLSKDLWFTLPS